MPLGTGPSLSPLKFSSLSSLSTRFLLGFRAGQQDRAQVALGPLELLNLPSGLGGRLVALAEVVFKRGGVRQVAADDRVDVGQLERVLGLHDGLGRGPGLERTQDQLQ